MDAEFSEEDADIRLQHEVRQQSENQFITTLRSAEQFLSVNPPKMNVSLVKYLLFFLCKLLCICLCLKFKLNRELYYERWSFTSEARKRLRCT